MKKIFSISLALIIYFSFPCYSQVQAPAIQWQNTIGLEKFSLCKDEIKATKFYTRYKKQIDALRIKFLKQEYIEQLNEVKKNKGWFWISIFLMILPLEPTPFVSIFFSFYPIYKIVKFISIILKRDSEIAEINGITLFKSYRNKL